jgi:hypothetical protein
MMAISGIKKWIIQKFAESVLGDVKRGEYGMSVRKIWDWLSGRKTAIGLLVTFMVSLQAQLPGLIEAFGAGQETSGMVTSVLGQLIIVFGAIHKAIKGS